MTLSNPNELRREAARRHGCKVRTLEALQAAGAKGLTNIELCEVGGLRACGARVPELRAEGHDIDAINLGGGLWRYILRDATPQPGTPGFLASLPVLASIDRAGRVQPATPPEIEPTAIGRLLFDL